MSASSVFPVLSSEIIKRMASSAERDRIVP